MQCPICYSNVDDDGVMVCCCQHFFHKPCLLEWIPAHKSCPICRKVINNITECIPAGRILERFRMAEAEKKNVEIEGLRQRYADQVVHELENIENEDLTIRSVSIIYDFLQTSNENQKILLEMGLLQKISESSKSLPRDDFEIKRVIFQIYEKICRRDRESLCKQDFVSRFSWLLSNSLNENVKELNKEILILLEEFSLKVYSAGTKIYRRRVMVSETEETDFCRKMESVYDSAANGSDFGSNLIKQLAAMFSFQFTPTCTQADKASKYFDILLYGIIFMQHVQERKRAFFVAMCRGCRLISCLNVYSKAHLWKCFYLPQAICLTPELLCMLVILKTQLTDEETSKEIIIALCPVFDRHATKGDYGEESLHQIRQIIEIVCAVTESHWGELYSSVVSSHPVLGSFSLRVLENVIQHPIQNKEEEEAKKYILLFHSRLVKKTLYSGDYGTVKVMSKVVGNCPEITTREDAKIAISILKDCDRFFPDWEGGN